MPYELSLFYHWWLPGFVTILFMVFGDGIWELRKCNESWGFCVLGGLFQAICYSPVAAIGAFVFGFGWILIFFGGVVFVFLDGF